MVWLGLTTLLNKWSLREDETKSMEYSNKLERLSAPGIVAFFFTITFCAIDYVMSLDASWASTIFGFLIAIGEGLTAMSLMVAVLTLLAKYGPIDHALTSKHLHDLGKLMLALVMLWAYLSFSQYLIIYSGNLPQEVTWYVRRLNGGWEWVGLALLLLHFALPFVLLLSQSLKKNATTISGKSRFSSSVSTRWRCSGWWNRTSPIWTIRPSAFRSWISRPRSDSLACGWLCFSGRSLRDLCCRWELPTL